MTELQEERLHIALKTAHFKKSIEFYTALFEVGPVKLKDGYAKFEVKSPSLNFTLNRSARQGANPTGSGAKGTRRRGSSTVRRVIERLRTAGVRTTPRPDLQGIVATP